MLRLRARLAPALFTLSLACGDPAGPQPKPDTAATTTATTTAASAATTAEPTATETATAEAPPSASATGSAAADAKTAATGSPSGAPSAQASAKPDVEGEQKTGASFSAYLAAKPSYKKGQPATVTAIVNPVGGYKINMEYPYKFKMAAAPPGVTYPEAIVRAVNRTEKRATMSIPFTPDAAGNATISGECSLSVCTDSNCVIEKVNLSVSVKVED